MKVLIFDPRDGGHRGIFLRHLYHAVKRESPAELDCVFYVSEQSARAFGPETEHAEIRMAAPFEKQGFAATWELMGRLKTLCKEEQPDFVFLMALGDLEWPLMVSPCRVPFSSILFVQYPEISSSLKRWFKRIKTDWILRRNQVCTLFLLNGEFSVQAMGAHHRSRGTRFRSLPDPVIPFDPPAPSVKVRGAATDRTRFLYFGAISERKGWDVLVEALVRIPEETLQKISLEVIGRPEDPLFFESSLSSLKQVPGLDLHVRQEFVCDREVRDAFCTTDVVLMPYRRPEYSSGVLGLAAQAGKPVIGPKGGLLGRIIQQNGLGVTTVVEEESLSEVVCRAIEQGLPFDSERAAEFVAASTPEAFSSKVLLEIISTEDV